eukprot:m.185684 g.185684  ORF g.185684 m.185684 type:complete len:786 (+) comp16523_c0_seq1:57-2414(+)
MQGARWTAGERHGIAASSMVKGVRRDNPSTMPIAWRTGVACFLLGLLVGSFYANLVFTHVNKATKAEQSSAVIRHHAKPDGHHSQLIVSHDKHEHEHVSVRVPPVKADPAPDADPTPATAAHGVKALTGWPPEGPIPVWVWMDYQELPGFIELNLRLLQHNAPKPDFQIHYVTPATIKSLIPDMPSEFDRMPYAAATSDLIRTALIAHHGGVYLDTDFLVQHPLHEFTDELADADFISYESHGQNCQKGQFSSNFVAGRKHNLLYQRSWESIKAQLARRCEHEDGTPEQGVCCYTKDGQPRKCHVPWAGVGERTSHPIAEALLAEGPSSGFRIKCYGANKSFVPPMRAKNNPKSAMFDSGHLAWIELDGKVCRRVNDDLLCDATTGGKDNGPWEGKCLTYFSRLAYHLFASIMATPRNRAISPAELISGPWAISELYRGGLKGAQPPPLAPELASLPRMYRDIVAPGRSVTEAPKNPASPPLTPNRVPVRRVGQCTTAYAEWSGTPLNTSDDFQCPQSNVTFVHVPKTAGTTVEGLARKRLGVIWGHDYDMKRWDQIKAAPPEKRDMYPKVESVNTSIKVCSGTCPCHQGCCWWHVPPKFLVDWRPYYIASVRFCLVRNPFKRMLSQYSWLGSSTCPSTKDELNKRDAWLQKHLRQFQAGEHWVGDCHFIPQHWYIQENVNMPWMTKILDPVVTADTALKAIASKTPSSDAESRQCNVVLRFENMTSDLEMLKTWTGVDVVPNYHKPYTAKCSNALSAETVELIRDIYALDFERYGYSTEWETLH